MTVTKYRETHPDCEYCAHNTHVFDICSAINKKKGKSRAKKCTCYVPEKWKWEKEEGERDRT